MVPSEKLPEPVEAGASPEEACFCWLLSGATGAATGAWEVSAGAGAAAGVSAGAGAAAGAAAAASVESTFELPTRLAGSTLAGAAVCSGVPSALTWTKTVSVTWTTSRLCW